MFIFPLGLLIIGIWLVLRRTFERVPHISLERITGIVLFFINLLTWFHAFLFPESSEIALQLAMEGEGGGYIGALILNALSSGLGIGGAFIALLAWLIISLVMVFDVSVVELFHWITPIIEKLQDAWQEWKLRHSKETPTPFAEFTPLRTNTASPGAASPSLSLNLSQESFTVTSPIQPGAPRQWELPTVTEILETGKKIQQDEQYDLDRARVIEETLSSFGARQSGGNQPRSGHHPIWRRTRFCRESRGGACGASG
jgi:S-DNA-T family DNA segregation ATPase FtsK/SpoIIIE